MSAVSKFVSTVILLCLVACQAASPQWNPITYTQAPLYLNTQDLNLHELVQEDIQVSAKPPYTLTKYIQDWAFHNIHTTKATSHQAQLQITQASLQETRKPKSNNEKLFASDNRIEIKLTLGVRLKIIDAAAQAPHYVETNITQYTKMDSRASQDDYQKAVSRVIMQGFLSLDKQFKQNVQENLALYLEAQP